MKIVQNRKEHRCSFEHCCFGGIIPRSSIAVTQIFKGEGGYFVLHFHPDCFIQSTMQYMNKKKEALETKIAGRKVRKISSGVIGRPRKYTDPMVARNLKSQLYYHQKAGNLDRVGEIERKIKGLEVKE